MLEHMGSPIIEHVCKEWWHLGRNGALKSWNDGGRSNPLPWKNKRSPLLAIPGAESPNCIRDDLAHIWPIGVGKEFAGSTILLLANMGLFPGRSIGDRLSYLYSRFREWCTSQGETTKISEFSLKVFKIQKCLV